MLDEEWNAYSNFFSKSRISAFKFCPLQYKKRYIEGSYSEQTYAMATGTRFHNFAEAFFDVAPEINPDIWEVLIHPDFTPYERRMIEFFLEYERMRLILLKYNYDIWKPLHLELKVVNEEYGIRGIIDRIDLIADNKVLLVENKTSKSINKPSLQREFGFYKLLLKNHPLYGHYEVVQGCVINPRVREVEFMAPSRESTILRDLDKLRNAIKDSVFEPDCTDAKYFRCNLCKDMKEANLYQITDDLYISEDLA